jgi:Pyridoxamine 5'-phosphate oxidase
MTQPVTELDARFSDRDAVATDWDETRRALEDAELFWIATVRADGGPHLTPLGRSRHGLAPGSSRVGADRW